MFHTAKENNVEIEVEWVPRSLNEKADYLSKLRLSTLLTGRLNIATLMMSSLLEVPAQ